MSAKFTRRRFLTALSAGAICLALTNTVGRELLGRITKLKSLHTPRVRPLHATQVLAHPKGSPLARPKGLAAAEDLTRTSEGRVGLPFSPRP